MIGLILDNLRVSDKNLSSERIKKEKIWKKHVDYQTYSKLEDYNKKT